MRLQYLAAGLVVSAGLTTAFYDSSPLLLVSTSPLHGEASLGLKTGEQALEYTQNLLSQCPTDKYLIVTQPGLNIVDLQPSSSQAASTPYLNKVAQDSRIRGQSSISEVVGHITPESLITTIDAACNRMGKDVDIRKEALPTLPQEGRLQALTINDEVLGKTLESFTKSDSFTILLIAPSAEPGYEAHFDDSVRVELKRDTSGMPMRRVAARELSDWDKLPLFEKYQFFTPGVFMVLVTVIVLFSILYVGISGLSSLQVSYGAFEKEMGPAAQKKQQ